MDPHDADRVRAELLEGWEQSAPGWERSADAVRASGMPVSMWLLDQLRLQPGQRVLDLAAGPGDTGFLAAELVQPGGTLISSDGTEAMVEVARRRAATLGIDNAEFQVLQLEWIDLPAASVDAILCRWGLMFAVDPGAAAQDARRVLRPGGRIAVAVWDGADVNPWATIPQRALVELGFVEAPDPSTPGMFALGSAQRLGELFEDAGFEDVVVDAVDLPRAYDSVEDYMDATRGLSRVFFQAWARLDGEERDRLTARITGLAEPYLEGAAGRLELPGRTLVLAAGA